MEVLKYLITEEGKQKQKKNDKIAAGIVGGLCLALALLILYVLIIKSPGSSKTGYIVAAIIASPIIGCIFYLKGAEKIEEKLNPGDSLLELSKEGISGANDYGTKFFVKWDNLDEIFVEEGRHPLINKLSGRKVWIIRDILSLVIPAKTRKVVIDVKDLEKIEWKGERTKKDKWSLYTNGLKTYEIAVLGGKDANDMMREVEDYMLKVNG